MTRYHAIKEPVKEILGSAIDATFRGVERFLVGRNQPNPKSIRDLGRSVTQASQVATVIQGLNEYRPFQIDVEDDNLGFDSEGNYHHPSLRTEHLADFDRVFLYEDRDGS